MNIQKNYVWVIIIFLLPILACSLLNRGVEVSSGALEADIGTQNITPTPPGEVIGEDVESVAPEEPTATPEPTAPPEPVSAPFIGQDGLDGFSSYRISFIQDFDGISGEGNPSVGRNEFLLEVTKDPKATHLRQEGEGTAFEALGGSGVSEIYDVGGTSYFYTSAVGDTWTATASLGDEHFSQGFFAPQKLIVLPETAQCSAETEAVHGIATYHCSFTEEDHIVDEKFAHENTTGNVWLAVEGDYIVKYEIETNLKRLPTAPDEPGALTAGTVTLQYELLEVNGDFSITPPAEAQEAAAETSLEGGGLRSDDIPVLDNAEEVNATAGFMIYYTQSDISTVIDFYRQQLSASGWQENTGQGYVDESTALLNFTKEGDSLTLTLIKESDNRVNVVITSE